MLINKVDKIVFSKRLATLMKDKGETTYSMSKIFGLSSPTISRYMTGQMAPKITTIRAFSSYFGVNEFWLMGYDIPMEPDKRFVLEDGIEIIELNKKTFMKDPDLFKSITEDLGWLLLPQPNASNFKYFSEIFNNDEVSMENKIKLIRSLVHVAKYNKKTGDLSLCMSFDLPPDEKEVISDYNQLNETGKKEAKKRINELTYLDDYRKKEE